MAKKIYKTTVDIDGGDWGGRADSNQGLLEGLPIILELFRAYKVQGLFFVSTELLAEHAGLIRNVKDHGHEIGSHGHFHTVFKSRSRQQQNKEIAEQLLKAYGVARDPIAFRAPKFSYEVPGEVYSSREGHIGLIRSTLGLDKPTSDSILYLHPFDIVEPKTKAPNLFCNLWYSHFKKATATLESLLNQRS